MAYTPELSIRSSCNLRRLAWHWNMPMTHAIEKVLEIAVNEANHKQVCASCKDPSKCEECDFKADDTAAA